MQRCGSSSRTPMCTCSQGTFVSAPVSHAAAHGISSHAIQARVVGSMYGVPAARPPSLAGILRIACTGQTSMQSPQRVHAATNATSGAAPGGRNQRFGATRSSVRRATSCSRRPIVSWKNARRSFKSSALGLQASEMTHAYPYHRSHNPTGWIMRTVVRIRDRKSTRLNSSHRTISYAVFCLKKKNEHNNVKLFNTARDERENIEVLVQTVERLADVKIGALMAIEQSIQLQEAVESGVAVDCV